MELGTEKLIVTFVVIVGVVLIFGVFIWSQYDMYSETEEKYGKLISYQEAECLEFCSPNEYYYAHHGGGLFGSASSDCKCGDRRNILENDQNTSH